MRFTRRETVCGAGAGLLAGAAGPLAPTPGEITGPFYPISKPIDRDADLTRIDGHARRALGQVIEISGRVLTPGGQPVPSAQLEIWQANAAGRYAHPSDDNPAPIDPDFQGYAQILTGPDGGFRLITVKPGAYPGGRRGVRTPHIHVDAAGRFDRTVTQLYFPGEPTNAADYFLSRTLLPESVTARANGRRSDGVLRFEWDIVLRHG